jgi:hypothetical protein
LDIKLQTLDGIGDQLSHVMLVKIPLIPEYGLETRECFINVFHRIFR